MEFNVCFPLQNFSNCLEDIWTIFEEFCIIIRENDIDNNKASSIVLQEFREVF